MDHQILFSVTLPEFEKFNRRCIKEVVLDLLDHVQTAPNAPDEALTAKQLAARMNCSVQKVYALVKKDRLPARRFGGQIKFIWSEVIESLPKVSE